MNKIAVGEEICIISNFALFCGVQDSINQAGSRYQQIPLEKKKPWKNSLGQDWKSVGSAKVKMFKTGMNFEKTGLVL